MCPDTKVLLSFAGRFLIVFFLALPLWFIVTPTYNRLLAAGANIVLSFAEDPHVHTLVGWKHNILIVRSDAPFTGNMRLQGFTGYLTHFNLILMVALVLAPRQVEWRRRCRMLAIAVGSLFLIHVLYLVSGVKFFQQPALETVQSLSGRLSVWGVHFYLSMAGQLFPVLIWMALYRSMTGLTPRLGKEEEV